MTRHHRSSTLLAGALALAAAATLCAQAPYRVLDHWKIGGTGGWDYLLADPSAHLLYLTHGPRVEVVDTESGKSVGAITGLRGTHGIALDPDGKVGYISDGGANAVVIFDRKTFATIATVPVGTNPDAITFEPVTKTVWAFNGRSNNASVIDAATRTVTATIPLPGRPEFAQPDNKGNVFANLEDKNSMVKLDARSKTVVTTWPMKGCESPSGLAIDRDHARLFAVCDGSKMAVVDSNSGKLLALPTIGDGPDAAEFDSKNQLAFSSNGQTGTLSILNTKGTAYTTLQTLPTVKGARTMTYDASFVMFFVY